MNIVVFMGDIKCFKCVELIAWSCFASGIIAIAVFIFRYKSGKWEHKAMV